MKDTILVQIASYRDPQLVPTVLDLLANAKYPENLKISIAWQHGPDEKIDELRAIPNINIIDIPYAESTGVCWARSILQKTYTDEKYTLALDSHHRFTKDWDETCIKMVTDLQDAGFKKPVLTSYIPSFDPERDPQGRVQVPWKMNFDRFIPEGAIFFMPASIPNFEQLKLPIPARFLSAHFIFTLGKFCKQVPYDPNYYFHGEEINMAVRAFTHGYDLFHPHRVVAWHEYTRKGRTKQWDDDKGWGARNKESHSRNRQLFKMDNEPQTVKFGKLGFGKVRSLSDYEQYAGISFKHRAVLKETLEHIDPPCPAYSTKEEFENSLCKVFKHCIDIQYSQVPEKDYEFWCVAFKGKDGKDVFRKDADKAEIARMMADPDKYCKVWREFQFVEMPTSWIVWPFSASKQWCPAITGELKK